MRVALLTTDNREHYRQYELATPYFGTAVEALVDGFVHNAGLEVHVISCTQKPMSSPDKLGHNIWFHLLDVPKIGWLRTGYQGCLRAIRHKLRHVQPDIVHGQGTERECALAAAFSGFPNVITIHGNMGAVAESLEAPIGSFLWCAARLESFVLPRTGGVLCNSAYTEAMNAPRAKRTWRVPNAVRREFLERPLPASRPGSTKPTLLNIGFIDARKRQLTLLDIAQSLHKAGAAFEVLFVGEIDKANPYSREFLDRIATAENAGYARYLGAKSLPELLSLMDTASALVHIPSEEAFGLVVVEALARNLKFFGTVVGGIPEITAQLNGPELFPLGDELNLREAIARWLSQGGPSPQDGTTEIKQRYHPEVVAQRHLEIYRQLLSA